MASALGEDSGWIVITWVAGCLSRCAALTNAVGRCVLDDGGVELGHRAGHNRRLEYLGFHWAGADD
eukprot:5318630-Prymnesium_polylepis.1